jgi:hypothetical protein
MFMQLQVHNLQSLDFETDYVDVRPLETGKSTANLGM